jgi:hypothetical protein
MFKLAPTSVVEKCPYRRDGIQSKRERDEQERGIESFLKAEEAKWRCPDCGGVVSCHNGICFDCGLDRLKKKKRFYKGD